MLHPLVIATYNCQNNCRNKFGYAVIYSHSKGSEVNFETYDNYY